MTAEDDLQPAVNIAEADVCAQLNGLLFGKICPCVVRWQHCAAPALGEVGKECRLEMTLRSKRRHEHDAQPTAHPA